MYTERQEIALNALSRIPEPPEFVYKIRWAIQQGVCRFKDKYAIRYRCGWLVHRDINTLLEMSKS